MSDPRQNTHPSQGRVPGWEAVKCPLTQDTGQVTGRSVLKHSPLMETAPESFQGLA